MVAAGYGKQKKTLPVPVALKTGIIWFDKNKADSTLMIIRKIRDYNSQRHAQMTSSEIVEDIRKGAEEVIRKYSLSFTYAKKLN